MPALEPNLARALERCYSLLYLLMRKSRMKSLTTATLSNGEVSVLRQVLKHAKLWHRFEEYDPLVNDTEPVGCALTIEQQRLFETAALWKSDAPLIRVGKDGKTYHLSTAGWQCAHAAATLAAYCGLRACEIKGLQWKDVDFAAGLLSIRRSKTPAGWRTPTSRGMFRCLGGLV